MKEIIVTGGTGFIARHLEVGVKYCGDICDITQVIANLNGAQGVVHFAAISDKRMFDHDPIKGVRTNLLGLCNVLTVALNRGMWVLFISTYQVKELHLYGLSKLMGEELCRVYKKKGLKVRIIRLPIVYGPGQSEDKVVGRILKTIREGKEPPVETTKKFDFAYVNDVAKMIENEVSVISEGVGKRYSIRDIVAGIKETLREEKQNEARKK